MSLFGISKDERTTSNVRGHSKTANIYLPIPRTTLFKKSVFYMGATLWNALPRNVRSCDDIDEFKLEINNIFVRIFEPLINLISLIHTSLYICFVCCIKVMTYLGI